MPSPSAITLNGQRYLTISYQKNINANDVRIDVQSSADLKNWVNEEALITVSETVNADQGIVNLTRRMASPLSTNSDTFLRILVTL